MYENRKSGGVKEGPRAKSVLRVPCVVPPSPDPFHVSTASLKLSVSASIQSLVLFSLSLISVSMVMSLIIGVMMVLKLSLLRLAENFRPVLEPGQASVDVSETSPRRWRLLHITTADPMLLPPTPQRF